MSATSAPSTTTNTGAADRRGLPSRRPRSGTAALIIADGRVVAANAEWCMMTRLSAQASKGDGWLQAFHPDDRPRGSRFVGSAGDAYVKQISLRLRSDIPVLLRSQLFSHQAGRVVCVISVLATAIGPTRSRPADAV